MIELVNVTKRFGKVEAVRGVSLHIGRGELVTLLGPSGSGKSTTLMMIAGHETPDTGAIVIDGKDVTYLPAHQRDIGMVFQHYALFPHLTVEENIAFPLRMRRLPKREADRKVMAALELVRLPGLGHRYPRQLSGGQQQRVALARALVFGPTILLMDEPLSSLDKKLREEMELEVKRLQRQLRITTIYVTHDQKEALILSDRVALLNQGVIEQVGAPDDLYDRPRNWFVADFIGESNFLAGRVVEITNGYCGVITTQGLVLWGLARGEVALGQEVTVAIRPESIFIGAPPTSGDVNQVVGVVEEVTYYGEGSRVGVRINDKESLIVKQGNTGLQGALAPGEKTCVSWKWSKSTIFADRRATA